MENVNAKNLEGKTALDIVDPGSGNIARKILMRGGAKASSSLVEDDTTFEDYLCSEPYLIVEMCIKFGAYLKMGLKGDMRNAFLVIIALVATATYQAALTPPGGGDSTITLAITSVNATTFIHPIMDNRTQTVGETSKFTIVNTICFGFAMGTCFILTLHPALYIFLYGPLCLFLVGYAFLTHGILNAGSIICALLVAFLVPIFSVIPWSIIVIKKELLTRGSDLEELKYLVYSSKYASKRSKDGTVGVDLQIIKYFKHAQLRCLGS
ncbi:uncharacterized protein Fot_13418 [Forsythia ovata]|uniref:PGG domain-containing protein n=1 Tax=Forsythia ovata TaxID=205694 RepID=A0ABD1W3E1_9LAMI